MHPSSSMPFVDPSTYDGPSQIIDRSGIDTVGEHQNFTVYQEALSFGIE